MTIENDAQLIICKDAGLEGKLNLYTKKEVNIKDNARVNVNTLDPTRLSCAILKKKFELTEDGQLCAALHAFDGELKVKDAAQFYGTFVGKKAKLEDGGFWHVDKGISGTVTTIGTGFNLSVITGRGYRWVETDN